jgi:hypothetical protein
MRNVSPSLKIYRRVGADKVDSGMDVSQRIIGYTEYNRTKDVGDWAGLNHGNDPSNVTWGGE